MKKLLLVLCLAIVPASAFAAGLDVSWNDCVNGALGTAATNKDFECAIAGNRNYNLEFQYKTPIDMANYVAINAYVDIGPYGAPLSPFWHYEGGGCNGATVKGVSLFNTMPAGCGDGGYLDTWEGGANVAGGIGGYGPDFQTPGRGHFVIGLGRAGGTPVLAADNMWAFQLRFNQRMRATCAGCAEQHVIIWQEALLEANDGQPPVKINGADKGQDCVAINNAPLLACGAVPTQNMTWGKIKSMFR